MRKLFRTIVSVLLIFHMVGCSEEKPIYEELINRAFVSEQALFMENSAYPEIVLFTKTTYCGECTGKSTMPFAIFSPKGRTTYSKLYKLKRNKYFETNTIFLEENDKNLALPQKNQLSPFNVEDKTLFVNSNKYFEVDYLRQKKWSKDNIYGQKFLITGNFLENKIEDSLAIIFSQNKNSDDEFILSNSKGEVLKTSCFHPYLTHKYPSLFMCDSKETFGFSFWGFLTKVKKDGFKVKILYNSQWKELDFTLLPSK